MKCPECGTPNIYREYFHGYPELACKCGYSRTIPAIWENKWEIDNDVNKFNCKVKKYVSKVIIGSGKLEYKTDIVSDWIGLYALRDIVLRETYKMLKVPRDTNKTRKSRMLYCEVLLSDKYNLFGTIIEKSIEIEKIPKLEQVMFRFSNTNEAGDIFWINLLNIKKITVDVNEKKTLEIEAGEIDMGGK